MQFAGKRSRGFEKQQIPPLRCGGISAALPGNDYFAKTILCEEEPVVTEPT